MWTAVNAERRRWIACLTVLTWLLGWSGPLYGQTLEIVDDQGTVLTGDQEVNVGEHVRLQVRAQPAGTTFTNPQWTVTGLSIKEWVTKDSEPVLLTIDDYLGETIHLMWKDINTPTATNVAYVSALVGSQVLSAQAEFRVIRNPKAEKFYSDDLLMESHNNWHSVHEFWAASTRRGDLFLAWHRSQVEYANNWREFFGYSPLPNWNPITPWIVGTVSPRQHPSTVPPPQAALSTRHDLISLDLTSDNLDTPTEGEYDLVTQSSNRGTNSEFAAAGYVLKTETVRQILCEDPQFPCADLRFSRNGNATRPTWWQPDTGQTAEDPWFANGCPARAVPDPSAPTVSTCSAQSKTSLENYTLRELGESIESGRYATNFQINYHALGHIAASGDMADPRTSMRDPIFWGWHLGIDQILSDWQATQGVEARGPVFVYTKPLFQNDWTAYRIAFSHRVIPELVKPENITVNGSPATSVADVSFTGTGYIFEFSGFPVPADGVVEVVVLREIYNTIRTSASDPRPVPTLIVSTFGNLLTPAVNRYTYTKP